MHAAMNKITSSKIVFNANSQVCTRNSDRIVSSHSIASGTAHPPYLAYWSFNLTRRSLFR